jgi:hypothetical protein
MGAALNARSTLGDPARLSRDPDTNLIAVILGG